MLDIGHRFGEIRPELTNPVNRRQQIVYALEKLQKFSLNGSTELVGRIHTAMNAAIESTHIMNGFYANTEGEVTFSDERGFMTHHTYAIYPVYLIDDIERLILKLQRENLLPEDETADVVGLLLEEYEFLLTMRSSLFGNSL